MGKLPLGRELFHIYCTISIIFLLLSLFLSYNTNTRERERKDQMLINKENVDIEFKRIYVPELRKDIVAFANTEGGTLYIGVADDGKIVGVDDTDEIMLRLSGSLKDSIAPILCPLCKSELWTRMENP